MIIRSAVASDVPAIISLLKIALGEDRTPKSETLWNWKHVRNPFGASPILVAEAEGKIAGIRAFLKWEYRSGNQVFFARRAVDTAVHPDFQNKGIFSQLTRKLLDKSRIDEVDLVFNTPNKKSTPGYLKLGWEKWDRLPVRIKPVFFSKGPESGETSADWEKAKDLIDYLEKSNPDNKMIQTRLVNGFMQWRYRECPVAEYKLVSDYNSYLLIYRMKENSWGKELRICDLFTMDQFDSKSLSGNLKSLERIEKPRFISVSGSHPKDALPGRWNSLPSWRIGPLITLKQLKPQLQPVNLPWAWTLGDLEVF